MKFCSRCAAPIQLIIPTGDTRERHVCTSCDSIFYQNPRNVVGTIPIWQDKVLLCKRAIHPRLGFWTLPAGFLEVGETTEAGAIRETLEEAGAMVTIGPLFSLLNVVHVEQVHLFYLASMQSEEFSAGIESLEVQLFSEHEIPWNEIAFPTVKHTLEWFFADRAAGKLSHQVHTHLHTVEFDPKIDRSYRSA